MTEKQMKALFWRIEKCNFSTRVRKYLKEEEVIYLGDLVRLSESELLKGKNFGPISLNEIKEYLTIRELSFEMEIPDWDAYKGILRFSEKITKDLWSIQSDKLYHIFNTLNTLMGYELVHQKGEFSMEEDK